LAWSIEYDAAAKKDLSNLDNQIARRIVSFMRDRVATLENPRTIGHALAGSELGQLWRYRVGDYRILCDIQDRKLIVLVVQIGHRREVYR
jgi:mRNA interferase RelE/StbE